MNNFGCPYTEMRTLSAWFESEHPGLDFHMNTNAPHYSSKATRIAFYNWTVQRSLSK